MGLGGRPLVPNAFTEFEAMKEAFKSFFDNVSAKDGSLKEDVPDEAWEKLHAETWNRLGGQTIEAAKNDRKGALRLAKFYEQLSNATDEEVEEYARMKLKGVNKALRDSWPEFAQLSNQERRKDRALIEKMDPR